MDFSHEIKEMGENMEQFFITELKIEKIRHLENITIPLAKDCRKHLILTGCNGSGKTSVLDGLAGHLNSIATGEEEMKKAGEMVCLYKKQLEELKQQQKKDIEKVQAKHYYTF